ncbi:MAG: N-acetyl-gamma-glutamyl-phosphate reductase [Longimicrobiales bacterium]|nr:N-acetyl-gamma-glutamyl-phosphate reductase [Longimicrobiales bacterium]
MQKSTTAPEKPVGGDSIRVSIAGATGYTGGELLRWLRGHSRTTIVHLAARQWAERKVQEAWPALRDLEDGVLVDADPEILAADSDVVFLAVPHGLAMELAASLLERGVRVIDLSADFRLKDPGVFAKWYGTEHKAPELLPEAVYGLTELHRDEVSEARLVANPGCYPTATTLALYPLARAGLLDGPVSVDAKSGASGAGRSPAAHTTFVEVNENVRPYGVGAHRHTPEMEQNLSRLGATGGVFFTPHLVPMSRGLLASCHFRLSRAADQDEVMDLFREAYDDEPFVRLLEDGLPETRSTLGSNFCDVSVRVDPKRGVGVALAALDNLGKGAASQAVQNLNAMFGIDEEEGLWSAPTFP